MCFGLFNPPNSLRRQVFYYSHFTNEAAEALRGQLTHPRPCHWEVELGCEPRFISLQGPGLKPPGYITSPQADGKEGHFLGEEQHVQRHGGRC